MDSYSAYIVCCVAIGLLRVAEGVRWRRSVGGRLSEFWVGMDACWAVLSVLVVMTAPSEVVRGVAIWFALGTLGSWFLVRKGHLLKTDLHKKKSTPLPGWYQEYMLAFGLGLITFGLVTLFRYSPLHAESPLEFALQATGALWLSFLIVTSVRALSHLIGWGVQRGLDRGVLSGLQDNSSCKELFGDIERIMCKPQESARYTHDGVLVYRVHGSRATGVVVAEFRPVSDSLHEVVQGLVYMDSGERRSLNVAPKPSKEKASEANDLSAVSELSLNH